MRFIKFGDTHINPNAIVSMRREHARQITYIFCAGTSNPADLESQGIYTVKEPPEQIIKMIKEQG